MRTSVALLSSLALLAPEAAFAASPSAQGNVDVTGHVATLCTGGAVTGTDSTFALGTLIDTATGYLLNNLTAPPKVVTGSFCNSRSTISVSATPMTAQSFTGTPPVGFTGTLDYTATASGWTTTPASYTTDATTNSASSQTRDTAFTGPISVAVTGFTPVGGVTLRPLADPAYLGTVTVTLTVAS